METGVAVKKNDVQKSACLLSASLLFWVLCIGVVLVILIALANAVCNARRMAIALSSESRLNQMQLAFHNYHDAHGQF
ncbi:MAG: hypothetical protein ACQESR_24455, partial [Planctomycetota bacterium]